MADERVTAPRPSAPPPASADTGSASGPARDRALSAGDRVAGQYRLIELLGTGGMGDVWLAQNETLQIEVAVKLVRPASDGEDAAERLLAEARAAARLGHPAIVRVFDFGLTDSGQPFIVMERLVGEDLGTTLGRLGRLGPVKAVRTLLPIVHALSAAHQKGIVHRDVKPENVFLAKMEGDRLQPKIVDFGIARVDRDVHRSGAEAVVGSPSYMSPEQARGEDADARSDVWSVSVVLYETIAGQKPFSADTMDGLVHAIVSDPPRPFPESPGLDDALSAIIRRGLEKATADRYPTTRELGEALVEWLLARDVKEDITGALVESLFGARPSDSELGEVALSPPAPHADRSRNASTVVKGARVQVEPPRTFRRVAVVAGAAIGIGILLGVVVQSRQGPAPAPSASIAGMPRPPARPLGSEEIPVEPLEAIPVDPALSASAEKRSGPAPASGAPATRTLRKPKRTLKDPFQ